MPIYRYYCDNRACGYSVERLCEAGDQDYVDECPICNTGEMWRPTLISQRRGDTPNFGGRV